MLHYYNFLKHVTTHRRLHSFLTIDVFDNQLYNAPPGAVINKIDDHIKYGVITYNFMHMSQHSIIFIRKGNALTSFYLLVMHTLQ